MKKDLCPVCLEFHSVKTTLIIEQIGLREFEKEMTYCPIKDYSFETFEQLMSNDIRRKEIMSNEDLRM